MSYISKEDIDTKDTKKKKHESANIVANKIKE